MHYGIIAAGEGSRLVQEGVALPKPLVNIQGTPMIKRLIDIFLQGDAESISIIVNEQMTQVREYLEALAPTLPVPLRLIVKSTPSSMHSFFELSSLMKQSGGKFILTTVDTIFRPDEFLPYVKAFADAPAEVQGLMPMTSFIDDEKPLYIEVDAHDRITAFLDAPLPDTRYVSGGIYGLTTPTFDVLEECMSRGVSRMRNFPRALVEAGLYLKGYAFKKIVDVDHAADIPTAEEFLNS